MLGKYIFKRFGHMVLIVFLISIINFIIIELPPGDYISFLKAELMEKQADPESMGPILKTMQKRFALDKPFYVRYLIWVSGVIRGDLGYSYSRRDEVNKIIGERIFMTMVIAIFTLIFTIVVAIPIGVYSAVRQYSRGDYFFTFLGFIGLAIPNFLLALVFQFVVITVFGAISVSGLFSPEFLFAPWSVVKFVDLLKHLWLPVIIVGTAGTAGMIRIVRARMLDTLSEPFIMTALMKGISQRKVILKHALRVAINPIISRLGMSLPFIISGGMLTAIVLGLPTVGPLLLDAVLAEDMYLACSGLLLLAIALVIGNFLADLILAWLDPRIRYG